MLQRQRQISHVFYFDGLKRSGDDLIKLYHKIGCLIASGYKNLADIYEVSKGKTKHGFLSRLDEFIKASVKLKDGAISFYFLSIEDMGLTDELSARIIWKINTILTDLLWTYRDDANNFFGVLRLPVRRDSLQARKNFRFLRRQSFRRRRPVAVYQLRRHFAAANVLFD